MGYPVVDEDEFLSSEKGILILEGGDRTLTKFAREKLGCRLSKGIDIVFKKNNKYYIGEAKFLTTPGGEQDRGFDDASAFIHEKSGNATRIAILDETDSGLDVDALKIVANGINKLRTSDMGILLITHYQRILKYIKPDKVYVMVGGKIVVQGGKDLVEKLEEQGYEGLA